MNSKPSHILLGIFFITAGILHFVFPAKYISIMPPWLPAHAALVGISGICEVLGGAGALLGLTRRFAGLGLILLSIAVLPANVQMLLNAHADDVATIWQTLLVMRLPLQALLLWWIWQATQQATTVSAHQVESSQS